MMNLDIVPEFEGILCRRSGFADGQRENAGRAAFDGELNLFCLLEAYRGREAFLRNEHAGPAWGGSRHMLYSSTLRHF